MSYSPIRLAERKTCVFRDLEFQLYRWPGAAPQPVLLLHGWGDCAETFQFLIDQLSPQRTFVAVDWRGFGRSQWAQDGYWFADYLADLDAIADSLSSAPIDLIGHSMGGNLAMLYAGIRPHRVRSVISLEGFGLSRTTAEEAPLRYRRWLDDVKNGTTYATYDSYEQFAEVLARRNPGIPMDRLLFIARAWAKDSPEGGIELRADPKHKRINPILYRREEVDACWKSITAPVLLVVGGQSEHARRVADDIAPSRLAGLISDATRVDLPQAGHMLHHEQPQAVARLVDEFLSESPS